jgi:hypothetical protein
MVERIKTPHYECGEWGLAYGRLRLESLSGNDVLVANLARATAGGP